MAEMRVLVGGLCLLPFLFLDSRWKALRARWVPIVIVGVFSCGVPFFLFSYATQTLTAGFAAILNATVPLFGAIAASVWLKERLTLARTLGLMVGFRGVATLVGFNVSFKAHGSGWAIVAALLGTLSYGTSRLERESIYKRFQRW